MATLTATGVNFSDGSTMNGTTVNTIGSYAYLQPNSSYFANGFVINLGTTVSGSTFTTTIRITKTCSCGSQWTGSSVSPGLSGTWRNMGSGGNLWVRVA